MRTTLCGLMLAFFEQKQRVKSILALNYLKISTIQESLPTRFIMCRCPKKSQLYLSYIKQKLDWICECIFLGRRDAILKYAEQYKRAVDYFLSQKLMNSDQQVLYAMYSKSGRTHIKSEIELQFYKNGHNPRFYLGYRMRKVVEGENSTFV